MILLFDYIIKTVLSQFIIQFLFIHYYLILFLDFFQNFLQLLRFLNILPNIQRQNVIFFNLMSQSGILSQSFIELHLEFFVESRRVYLILESLRQTWRTSRSLPKTSNILRFILRFINKFCKVFSYRAFFIFF